MSEFLAIVVIVLYGLLLVIVWALPFVLIIGGLFLAAKFIRKLVLDAVREAHKQ